MSAPHGRVQVVDVWANNVEEELALLRSLPRSFPMVAVATSQEDVHTVPDPALPRTLDARYEAVRATVDRVRFAQIGLALTNVDGELALGGRVWRFHVGEEAGLADPYRVCGAFRECSRAAAPEGMWVTRNGAHDMAYLARYLNGGVLPSRRDRFLHLCNVSFPQLYDLKVLAEWTTVAGREPPLAGWKRNAFGGLLALKRARQFIVGLMVGYNAFLSGLGAADDHSLVVHKRRSAELQEKDRRFKELLLGNGAREEDLRIFECIRFSRREE